MKKKILILIFALGAVALVLSACGGTPNRTYYEGMEEWERAVREVEEATRDLPAVDPTGTPSEREVMDEWDEAMELADAWGGIAADYEMREYEDMRSLSVPGGFPSFLIYGNGKVSYVRDDSTDTRVNISIGIKTPDDLEEVENFYVDQIEGAGWKVESQSARSDSYIITATHENERVTVNISTHMYTSLVDINMSYSDRL